MHSALWTLVLLLSIALTFSLSIDVGKLKEDNEIGYRVKSECSDTEDFCNNLECSYESISLILKIKTLAYKGIDYTKIHLRDRTCTQFKYDSENVYVAWPLGRDVCGTGLNLDDIYATYENEVFFPPTGPIYREIYVLNVSCSYPLDYNASLPEVVRPDVSITYIDINGTGKFRVKMELYADPEFNNQFLWSPVDISTKSYLYVRVYIEDPILDYDLLMVNCFSTPTSNSYSSPKYDIIKDSCPNMQDSTIRVLANGVTTEGKFFIQAFKFVGDYTYVYLHCKVHLCSGGCAPVCFSSRNARAAASVSEVQGTVSFGPIRSLANSGADKSSAFNVITMIGLAIMNWIFL